MTQLEIAQAAEITKLQKQNELMRKLATREGFYNAYFEACKTSKTNSEAFHKVSDQYFDLFKKNRYSDYGSFRTMENYYNNKRQKK